MINLRVRRAEERAHVNNQLEDKLGRLSNSRAW
uniref:Uncharacterized protein n=1 Tax=Musa acuminata subsp. malaccensis TaxID=214687 RepID=A0A804KG93_MUSAM